jgi:signal transduction histidine kinase
MTASPFPTSTPRARLWLAVIALTCCFTVYLIAAPLLYHGPAANWPLAADIVAAAVAAVAAAALLVMMWLLRRENAAAEDALAQRDEQAEWQVNQYREREQQLQQLQRECAALRDALTRNTHVLRQAVEHTVATRLPAALDGSPVPAAKTDGIGKDLAELLERAVTAAAGARDRQESMRTAVVALSRRVQTSAHRLQEEATLMAKRHPGDVDVLAVSMGVDHAAAQQARHAQSMAVLCGEWPGQQWLEPLPLVDVVRAAAGRIIAYQRIEVSGDPDIAAAPPVVEPLIHLVAELLANATQSSPPTTQVPVTVRAVQRGAVIEIHDCGVGLDEYRLAQAREIAAGIHLVGLDQLGEVPQTGLAVVGQYVRRHGFRVDVSESVYGGVRAVVGVPAGVVETVEPAESAVLAVPAVPAAEPPPEAQVPRDDTVTAAGAGSGLPRRRSPRHAGGVPTPAAPPVPATSTLTEQPQTPEQAGAWMGAFLGEASPADDGSETFASANAEDSPK